MNHSNHISQLVFQIADETFTKLHLLEIPPYPKYYHDMFLEILEQNGHSEILELSKKNAYLFSTAPQEETVGETCLGLVKKGLEEFVKTNDTLKSISDETAINIDAIKKDYNRIDTDHVFEAFMNFQGKIFQELQAADETISSLKLEVERLERESNIDPLTKTHNRRVLMKDLEEVLQSGKDKELDMHLVMFDADDFKQINDSFGHIAGDKTLIFLSKLIQNSLRRGTRIYRYGGEEFVVILNRTSKEEAIHIVERILKETSDSKLLYKNHDIHLTLSAGICSHVSNISADEILEKADTALYEAKRNGKNCFRSAS
ncbi:GGDEF domain-containing protein [Sulfurospirillum barnesii]|uniref:diguanylate cyclase n=1 Tax=Sulfurospirillum barnesii (strain ATCC 700032 / DSM 10660 / SES-3) TaxID=760154 RepID=I3XVH1_SULBS|nr:GGDEF domain-containing protein [Sulfurospirillum barnesii]AFL67945.1 diguanylate cyclase (GGDEF) domain-containing protein [Sulfurospirillum barnesii SES-3]